jgi:3-hydroxyisobutyrate dehydrogenase-like beta-hydroxyacid dehydrogenase
MSTVSPDLVIELEKKHQDHGITFLVATVSGRPDRAKAGALWIFLAGEEKAKTSVNSLLQTMGCKIFDLGDRPSQSALFKLCNNFMILSFVESLSEALTMLEKGGVSPEKGAEIWGNSLFDSPIFHTYAPVLNKRTFAEGGFALKLGLKDIRLLQAYADESQVPMPFLADLHQKLLMSMNLGREKFDWSAIAMITREQAGLK